MSNYNSDFDSNTNIPENQAPIYEKLTSWFSFNSPYESIISSIIIIISVAVLFYILRKLFKTKPSYHSQ
jgi:hypothetical protein